MVRPTYNWELLAITRFFLALIVMTGHLPHYTGVNFFKFYSFFGSLEAILGFLLVSGLSIGKSLQRNPQSYFKRRIQRIYPVYIASMALVYLTDPVPITGELLVIWLINLLFLNQIITQTSYVGPAWTLALEVWLYALAPWLNKLSFKQMKWVVCILFFTYCIHTVGRSIYGWHSYAGAKWGLNILFLAYVWVVGFALAKFEDQKSTIAKMIAAIFIITWVITAGLQFVFRIKNNEVLEFVEKDLIKYVCRAVTLAAVYYIVIYSSRIPDPSIRVKKIFSFLGNISYPLYLTHLTVIKTLAKYNVNNTLVMVLATLVVAVVIYLLFDFYSKRRKIVPAPITESNITVGKDTL
jgi:peptidoglycan/LPS O-acetylase OafA/YrhL